MTVLRCVGLMAMSLLVMACEPTEQQKAKFAEEKRIECLDKICPGDVAPTHDQLREFALKLNGQWFVAPRAYGGYGGSFAFFWPSKTPARMAGADKMAPEFIPSSAGVLSNFYDVAIEIFLRHHDGVFSGPSRYERLKQAEAQGRLISKELPRDGLEVWHTRETDGLGPGLWYIATKHVGTDPNGAVLSCRDGDPKFARCVTAFEWRPGIAADMRFRAKHADEWPEIYQEAVRVLRQLRGDKS